ncbi:MAG: ATP-binding protein [Thiotrichales bacterium]
MEEKLERLLNRLEALAMRAEAWLPAPKSTNWDAIAFRYEQKNGLQSIAQIDEIHLEDLLHIDRQKQAIVANTKRFLANEPCNHALLWGSRGTGKSSLVKALLNDFSAQGLKLIEVDKEDLTELHQVIAPLHARPEKFVLYCDDLSFESNESGYKALKAALDGSIAKSPANVLIYATSNRRHLLPEQAADNSQTRLIDTELHHGESVEEKISLSERFGLWLAFHPFNQTQYLAVVDHWMKKLNMHAGNHDEMTKAALQFALLRGSRSGRVARQFVNQWSSESSQ